MNKIPRIISVSLIVITKLFSFFSKTAVFLKALQENFSEAEVEVIDCPDLTQEPFTLAAPGNFFKSQINFFQQINCNFPKVNLKFC